MKLTNTICVAALVAAAGLVSTSAFAVPNPTGDVYSWQAINLVGFDGPVDITFDGIPEDVGSATVNESYWQWDGGLIQGETITGGDNPGNFTYAFETLSGWDEPGAVLEWHVQNNIPNGGIHSDWTSLSYTTYGATGLDLNNGPAVPTISTGGFYTYFTQGGTPVPFQTGKLFLDTDIFVGEHPFNAGQEVYYIDFAQSDIDNIFDFYAGGLDFENIVDREFQAPGSGLNLTDLVKAVGLNLFLGLGDGADGFPTIDGYGFGYLIKQESPALAGDGNGDGMVDGLDYLLWAGAFGDDPAQDPPGSPANGDYDNNGVVDGLDYLVWAGNFGAGVPATAVPEPGTFALAGMALVGLFAARRRR